MDIPNSDKRGQSEKTVMAQPQRVRGGRRGTSNTGEPCGPEKTAYYNTETTVYNSICEVLCCKSCRRIGCMQRNGGAGKETRRGVKRLQLKCMKCGAKQLLHLALNVNNEEENRLFVSLRKAYDAIPEVNASDVCENDSNTSMNTNAKGSDNYYHVLDDVDTLANDGYSADSDMDILKQVKNSKNKNQENNINKALFTSNYTCTSEDERDMNIDALSVTPSAPCTPDNTRKRSRDVVSASKNSVTARVSKSRRMTDIYESTDESNTKDFINKIMQHVQQIEEELALVKDTNRKLQDECTSLRSLRETDLSTIATLQLQVDQLKQNKRDNVDARRKTANINKVNNNNANNNNSNNNNNASTSTEQPSVDSTAASGSATFADKVKSTMKKQKTNSNKQSSQARDKLKQERLKYLQPRTAAQGFHRICLEWNPGTKGKMMSPYELLKEARKLLRDIGIQNKYKEVSLIGKSLIEIYVADICVAEVRSKLAEHHAIVSPIIDRMHSPYGNADTNRIVNRIAYILARNHLQKLRDAIIDGFPVEVKEAILAKELEIKKLRSLRTNTSNTTNNTEEHKDNETTTKETDIPYNDDEYDL